MMLNLIFTLLFFAGAPAVYFLLMWVRPVPFAELAVSARHWFVIAMGLCGFVCVALLEKLRAEMGLPYPDAFDRFTFYQALALIGTFGGSVFAVNWYTRTPNKNK